MKRIGFATQASAPEGSPDDFRAAPLLAAAGYEVVPVVWEALLSVEALAAEKLSAVVIRSCWDYHLKTQAFLDWVRLVAATGLPVLNSSAITCWNMDKHYLRELSEKGVSIPRTVWLETGSQGSLASVLELHHFDAVVVKPCVSLGAFQTWRSSRAEAAAHEADFQTLVAERAIMVQEFMPEILMEGEVSLLFFGGEFSHAVRKRARSGEFRIQQHFGGVASRFEPTPTLLKQARQVLETVGEPLTFARVDGVEVNGELKLMELELIDPYLFLELDAESPARFARAVIQALASAP